MDSIFNILNASLDELWEIDREAYARILAAESYENIRSDGKVLPLTYYRHYGRPFNLREWEKGVAAK